MSDPRSGRVAVAVLLALALAGGCAESPTEAGPGGAVRQFYDRLNSGDHAGATTLYSAEVRGVFEQADDQMEAFQGWAETETKSRSVSEVRIVSATEGEASAEVQFEVHFRDGSTVSRRVTVVQEDGAWKLGFIS